MVGHIRECFIEVVNNMKHHANSAYNRAGGTGPLILPGLNQRRGIKPFIPILQQCLKHGSSDQKLEVTKLFEELLNLIAPATLKKNVVAITGPLIRIAGEANPSEVKLSILRTLSLLLVKGGMMMKPFISSLQTCFVKNLKESSSKVRKAATQVITVLLSVNNKKIGSLVRDLCKNITITEGGMRDSMLSALLDVLQRSGQNVDAGMIGKSCEALRMAMRSAPPGTTTQTTAAKALGYATAYLPDELRAGQLKALAAFAGAGYDEANMTLTVLTQLAPMLEVIGVSVPPGVLSVLRPFLIKQTQSDKYFIRQAAVRCIGWLVVVYSNTDIGFSTPKVQELLRVIDRAFNDSSEDVRGSASATAGAMLGSIDNADYLSGLRPKMLSQLLKNINTTKHVTKFAATFALATVLHAGQADEEQTVKAVAADCPSIAGALTTVLPRLRRAVAK